MQKCINNSKRKNYPKLNAMKFNSSQCVCVCMRDCVEGTWIEENPLRCETITNAFSGLN